MMQVDRTIVRRVSPESSTSESRVMAVSLPRAPFPVEVDPHRRDTAPRAAITRLPARKPRVVATVEPGIMDMGGMA